MASFQFLNFIFKCLPLNLRLRAEKVSIETRAIMRGMFWVTFFLLLAKAVGAGKEILVAERYGTSAVVDGYLFVFNLTLMPVSVFANVTAVIVVPYMVTLQKEKLVEAQKLQDALLPLALLLGIATGVIFGAIMWWIISHFDLGLTEQSQAAALIALTWVAPGIVFAFMGVVLSNWLMSKRQHTNTLLEGTPAGVIAVCLLIWPFAEGQMWDVWPLAVGTFLGFFLQALLLSRASRQQLGFLHLRVMAEHWPALRSALGIMLLTQVILTSTNLTNQFVALHMGEGVLASYTYAERVLALLLGLTATVVSRSMLPILSGISDTRKSFDLSMRWASRLAGLGLLVTLGLLLTAEFTVAFLFQRGAFTESDTHAVTKILTILGLQIPFYLFSSVLVQWLSASGNTARLFTVALGGLLAKLLGVLLWFDHGAIGLALSTSLMCGVTSIMIYVFARIAQKHERASN